MATTPLITAHLTAADATVAATHATNTIIRCVQRRRNCSRHSRRTAPATCDATAPAAAAATLLEPTRLPPPAVHWPTHTPAAHRRVWRTHAT